MTSVKSSHSVVDSLHACDHANTFIEALTVSGMISELESGGPYTIFAPTDAAFEALPAGSLDGLLADKETLRSVLSRHVVSGTYMASDVIGSEGYMSLDGTPLSVDVNAEGVYVCGSRIVSTDLVSDNGVVHLIDTVIDPSC